MSMTTAQPLAVADRCDRCGARAYVRATLPGGGELLFCAHHGRAHEVVLRTTGATIDDFSHVLVAEVDAMAGAQLG